jgi:hypothetical protein
MALARAERGRRHPSRRSLHTRTVDPKFPRSRATRKASHDSDARARGRVDPARPIAKGARSAYGRRRSPCSIPGRLVVQRLAYSATSPSWS